MEPDDGSEPEPEDDKMEVSRDSRRLTGGRDSGGSDELVGDEEDTGETSSAGGVVNKKDKETVGVGDTVEEGEA